MNIGHHPFAGRRLARAQRGVVLLFALIALVILLIGGVALIRAAAKNHEFVTVVTDPADYDSLLTEMAAGGTSLEFRRK